MSPFRMPARGTLLLFGMTVAACFGEQQPSVDSETHFLVACETRADCPEVDCLCGFCTTPCRGATATCELCVASAAIGEGCGLSLPTTDLCAVGCTSDATCGAGFRCGADHFCVTADPAAPPPGDASGADGASDATGALCERTDGALPTFGWHSGAPLPFSAAGERVFTFASPRVDGLRDLVTLRFAPRDAESSPLKGTGALAIDADPATCRTCVYAAVGCDTMDRCQTSYVATSGLLEVTTFHADPLELAARVRGASMAEAVIAPDGAVALVVGGGAWCLDGVEVASEAACAGDDDCTSPSHPHCVPLAGVCGECATSYDCAASAPVCDADHACAAATSGCLRDDAREPDDGPSQASALALGEAVDLYGCPSDLEADWLALESRGGESFAATVRWSDPLAAVAVDLQDAAHAAHGTSLAVDSTAVELVTPPLPAGRHHLVVRFEGDADTAVPYTVEVVARPVECGADAPCAAPARPHCVEAYGLCAECLTSFDCAAAAPACVPTLGVGACRTVDLCTDDDPLDADDGPSAATPIALGDTVSARICGRGATPSGHESDWYVLDKAAGAEGFIELESPAATAELDLFVFDEAGRQLDYRHVAGEAAAVFMAATDVGRRLIEVVRGATDAPPTVAEPYTLRITP